LALLSALNTHSRLFGAGNNTERGELLLVRGLTGHKSGRIKFKDLAFSARFFGNTNLVLYGGLNGSQNFWWQGRGIYKIYPAES
jgi:hypothetical protein